MQTQLHEAPSSLFGASLIPSSSMATNQFVHHSFFHHPAAPSVLDLRESPSTCEKPFQAANLGDTTHVHRATNIHTSYSSLNVASLHPLRAQFQHCNATTISPVPRGLRTPRWLSSSSRLSSTPTTSTVSIRRRKGPFRASLQNRETQMERSLGRYSVLGSPGRLRGCLRHFHTRLR